MKSCFAKGLVLIFLGWMLAGCGGGGQVGMEVKDAWARAVAGPAGEGAMLTPSGGHMPAPGGEMAAGGEMMAGMNSAAYMVLQNNTGKADRLLRVESDVATAVELHKSEVVNEMMTMRPVDSIEIPAGGEARLEPGGLHVMLIGLQQPLEAGSRISLTLIFETAGEIQVEAEVRAP